jgi:hypothetical protein
VSRAAEPNRDTATRRTYGFVTVAPTRDVVAGSYGTWTVTYTVGAYAMDVGGGLKIGTRRQSDFGTPQFDDPKAPNYVTVRCSRPARLKARFDPRGHIRPYRAVIVIDLDQGPLYPGDVVTVVMGDTSGGSPGMVAQSIPESAFEFAVFVDPLSSGLFKRVYQESPPIRIVPGPSERIEVLAPSTVVAGKPFRVQVRGSDRSGNPTPTTAPGLILDAEPPIALALSDADGRAKWIDGVTLRSPGARRLTLRSQSQVLAESNPIMVHAKPGAPSLLWGDTQAQTASTVGIGTVAEYYRFARDLAGLDFVTHQGNDFMLSQADIDEVRNETKRFHEPGVFVPFFGYEWSGATGAGGDRNVLYLEDDGPIFRSSGWQLEQDEDTPETERVSAADLQESLRALLASRGDLVLLIPHIGGRRADLASQDPALEPVFEICSCHGVFEWRLHEALARGLRVGVVGASDDHTGRPGLAFPSTPEMAIQGGLGAVMAESKTREGIFAALKARRCYATTGARIYLDVRADGHPVGAAFDADRPPRLTSVVHGTAPLDEIRLFDRDREVLCLTPNPLQCDPRRVRLLWNGANSPDRGRSMAWDGGVRLTAGRIIAAEPLNMFAAKYGIVERREDSVTWRSVTAGLEQGVMLELDAPDDAALEFAAGPARFEMPLRQVRAEDIVRHFGGLGQTVCVSTRHATGTVRDATIDVTENALSSGEHAYWLRVVQRDFHRAWSSPIYVNLVTTAKKRPLGNE